jgi:tRNA-modifying protein YgfZ
MELAGIFLKIPLGRPAIFQFTGPDAVRFLNGQVTQDVRRVADGRLSLPSCITDAKGRLQFRVVLMAAPDQKGLWVVGEADLASALEARLTRYLIADDVEVSDLSGSHALCHVIPPSDPVPDGVLARESMRFGQAGTDCFFVDEAAMDMDGSWETLEGDALEHFRISRHIPKWGAELLEGMLPPEAGLDRTDVSYAKGCYIGQEVISRIKSAGKVNRRLAAFRIGESIRVAAGDALVGDSCDGGVITSVSPLAEDGWRSALGYVKRGQDAGRLKLRDAGGALHPIQTPEAQAGLSTT